MISVAIIKEKKFCIKMYEFIIINCSRPLFHCSILARSMKVARVGSLRSAHIASWHHQLRLINCKKLQQSGGDRWYKNNACLKKREPQYCSLVVNNC